jgi:glycosyltransferase involved in cell wall biosynthesis
MLPWLWRHRLWLAEQDILHCHLTYGAVFGTAVGLWRAALGAQQPAIVETYHAVGMPIPPLHRWFHARLAARRDALALMAEDKYWRAFLTNRPGLLSAFITNGISVSRQYDVEPAIRRAYRRELGIPDECRFVIGTVGMLRPERQPWLYLPIFAEVARIFGSEVHFVLAGGGSELDRMRSLVIEHGLAEQVHLPGLILDPSLPLSIMDLYITLNVGAITGVAALEAALSNLPVLGIQMLAGYQAGPDDWIWSSTDLLEIAERAIKLLQSTTERQTLAEQQRAYARAHHTTEAMASSYYALYQAATERLQKKTNGSDSLPQGKS